MSKPKTYERLTVRKHKIISLFLLAAVVACGMVTIKVSAADTPPLGAAESYGILANTYTNSAPGTTVNGDVGFLVAPTVEPAPQGGHANYGSSPPYAAAGADQTTALNAL